MLVVFLAPLLVAIPIWLWRYGRGQALGLSQRDMNVWRAVGDYSFGLTLFVVLFHVLDRLQPFRTCFLLVDARCDVSGGELLGPVGFIFLMATPLGGLAAIYSIVEIAIRARRLQRTRVAAPTR